MNERTLASNERLRAALEAVLPYIPEKEWIGGIETGYYQPTGAALLKVRQQIVDALAEAPTHETPEQLLWTLEWRASFDGPWTPYYAIYPTREKARAAMMNARGEASEWRTVPLKRAVDPEAPSEKAVDQRAIDANALADAHRMYEAEHGHPFSESEPEQS